jgi:sugar phosphate isomerase/epimerase
MLKPAFSTVACPDWNLRTVAQRALELGFEAVELRTFGDDSRLFACDPALTAEAKTRQMFLERGVEVLCLGTSVRFDEPVWPPVIGLFSPVRERSVREGKRAIDLAVGLECPLVRVFGFEYPTRERKSEAMGRIASRLGMMLDHADKSGVRVVLENGGSFSTSEQMLELMDKVRHPLLGACYSLAAGVIAGEDPVRAVAALGPRMLAARISDAKAGVPCQLGQGDLPVRAFFDALIRSKFDGPLVYSLDRAWSAQARALQPEALLQHASRTIYSWLGAPGASGSGGAGAGGRGAVASAR